ncbi:MAG: hypothetical protein ACREYE_22760, partial [Gammaproteobacteria bacterium]
MSTSKFTIAVYESYSLCKRETATIELAHEQQNQRHEQRMHRSPHTHPAQYGQAADTEFPNDISFLHLRYFAPAKESITFVFLAPQQNLWVVFYLIDPMELRASEENNDSDASPTGSGCGYM